MSKISPQPGTSLYGHIEGVLADEITSGILLPGRQLPTEDELIQRFGVSRITVRRAVQELVLRGLAEIRRGIGTFVTQPKIIQELTELSGFVEDMRALGRTPTARVVNTAVVPADKHVADRLAVPAGTQVMRIKRVRLADGIPMSFDETYLPLEIGEKVITNDLKAEPIFTLLEDKYQIPLVAADYLMEAVTADASIAAELGIANGSPVFLIERTSFTQDNRPIDHERLFYRGDLIRFTTRLARKSAQ